MNYIKRTFKGGTHIKDYKEYTNSLETVVAKVPAKVYIPMSMHIGAPSKPLVAVGDQVKMGQIIAESQGFVSVPAHASVSGKVVDFVQMPVPNGRFVDCVVIENDFQDQWIEAQEPVSPQPQLLDAKALSAKVLAAGVVGMGGATFPTHVKYAPSKEGKKADHIILNGIECEPFITADHRIMLEKSDRIIAGLKYLMKIADCPKGVIAIEANKMDVFEKMHQLTQGEPDIEAVLCEEKYPQGSEKQLIYAVTGREIPPGGLPLDVGVIVNNVATAVAVADAVEYNRPLIDRIVTINGNGIAKPGNYLVRIGTLYQDLIEEAGGFVGTTAKVISGGPMMGFAVYTTDMPVMKGTSGILVFNESAEVLLREEEGPCVRCARCIDACPMGLEPTSIMKKAKRQNWAAAKEYDAASCIECGSCSYVCPSLIPLVQYIRLAKQYVMSKDGQGAVNPLL